MKRLQNGLKIYSVAIMISQAEIDLTTIIIDLATSTSLIHLKIA